MKILQYPDPALTRICDEVKDFGSDFQKEVQELYKTILECPPGSVAGMAANQIGIPKRFFYAQGKLFVNPKVIPANGQKLCQEGCFSSPEGPTKLYRVWRRQTVWVDYQDHKGLRHYEKYNGFMAQVIQHEMDHNNGVMCINREEAIYGKHSD